MEQRPASVGSQNAWTVRALAFHCFGLSFVLRDLDSVCKKLVCRFLANPSPKTKVIAYIHRIRLVFGLIASFPIPE